MAMQQSPNQTWSQLLEAIAVPTLVVI